MWGLEAWVVPARARRSVRHNAGTKLAGVADTHRSSDLVTAGAPLADCEFARAWRPSRRQTGLSSNHAGPTTKGRLIRPDYREVLRFVPWKPFGREKPSQYWARCRSRTCRPTLLGSLDPRLPRPSTRVARCRFIAAGARCAPRCCRGRPPDSAGRYSPPRPRGRRSRAARRSRRGRPCRRRPLWSTGPAARTR
jgi:hypothetical protein